MPNRILAVAILAIILGVGACDVPNRPAGASEAASSWVNHDNTLFTKEAAIKRAIGLVGTESKTQIIDVRLLKHEEAASVLGSRPGYEQMKDYPYQPDTPVWAVTLFVEGGVALIDPNPTPGFIFLLVAGDGNPEYMAGLGDPQTNPAAIRLRALPDLAGQLEIVPIPIPTTGPLPPTATPVPVNG